MLINNFVILPRICMGEFESRLGFGDDLKMPRDEYFQKLEDIDQINDRLRKLKGVETKNGIVLQELRLFAVPEFNFGNPSLLRDKYLIIEDQLIRNGYPETRRVPKTIEVTDDDFAKDFLIRGYNFDLSKQYPELDWKILGQRYWMKVIKGQTPWPDIPQKWMITEILNPMDKFNEGLIRRKNLSYAEVQELLEKDRAEILSLLGFLPREFIRLNLGVPTLPELVYLKSVCPETLNGSSEWTSTKIKKNGFFSEFKKYNILWNQEVDSGWPEVATKNERDTKMGYRVLIKPDKFQSS